MVTHINVVPAEGREYSLASQVKEAWQASMNFEVTDVHLGDDVELINKNNKPADTRVIVWYDDGRKHVIIK